MLTAIALHQAASQQTTTQVTASRRVATTLKKGAQGDTVFRQGVRRAAVLRRGLRGIAVRRAVALATAVQGDGKQNHLRVGEGPGQEWLAREWHARDRGAGGIHAEIDRSALSIAASAALGESDKYVVTEGLHSASSLACRPLRSLSSMRHDTTMGRGGRQ